MDRYFLRAKLHGATVTEVDRDYEGSLGVDAGLLQAARLAPFERVEVYNVSNGSRLATYVVPLPSGSRRVVVYGAAAHLARPGDRIIVAAYARLGEEEIREHRPLILRLDAGNRVREDGPAPLRIPGRGARRRAWPGRS